MKRDLPIEEFISDDAYVPDIDFGVIMCVLGQFRGGIKRGST